MAVRQSGRRRIVERQQIDLEAPPALQGHEPESGSLGRCVEVLRFQRICAAAALQREVQRVRADVRPNLHVERIVAHILERRAKFDRRAKLEPAGIADQTQRERRADRVSRRERGDQ